MTEPKFMLLDEPFAGVDPIAVLDIQRIIRFLKERGIGVLITDHNVRETLGICDRAYIINEGQVIFHGTADEVRGNELVRRIYLGERFDAGHALDHPGPHRAEGRGLPPGTTSVIIEQDDPGS